MAELTPLPGVISVIQHDQLFGLGDDDHPQYLLADGSRTLTGNLNLNGNNIVNASLVNGRDLVFDGDRLDYHLNTGNSKHDASEIDVEGTYANILGTPTDLESTISAIDTALNTPSTPWSRAGSVISPVNANDALSMLGLDVRVGSDFFSTSSELVEFSDGSGNVYAQWSAEDPYYLPLFIRNPNGDAAGGTDFNIVSYDDYTFSSGHSVAWWELFSYTGDAGHRFVSGNQQGTLNEQRSQIDIEATKYTSNFKDRQTDKNCTVQVFANGGSLGTLPNMSFLLSTGREFAGEFATPIFGVNEIGTIAGGTRDARGSLGSFKKWRFESLAPDEVTSVGYELVTQNDLTAAGAKLFSLVNLLTEKFSIDKDGLVSIQGTKVLGSQEGAIVDASGGATVDTEARTAINALLAACRAHGLIAT